MGSASVSSNNMLLLWGFLELPKNPVVASVVARCARRWFAVLAVVLLAVGQLSEMFWDFLRAGVRGVFSPRGLLECSIRLLASPGTGGTRNRAVQKRAGILLLRDKKCLLTCSRASLYVGLRPAVAVIDGLAARAHGAARLAAQRAVTLPCGTTQ